MSLELSTDLKNKLYAAYLEFMKIALKKMSPSIRVSRRIRKSYQKQKLVFGLSTNDFRSVKQDIKIYDFAKYIVEASRTQFESLAQYTTIVELMNNNEIIRPHLGNSIVLFSVIHRLDHWSYISHILRELLFKKIIRNKFDIFLFDKLFFDLVKFFESKEISFSMVSPLHYFHFINKRKSLKLSNSFAIRKITRNERIRLGDKFIMSESESDAFDTIKYVIEHRFGIVKDLNLSRRIDGGLSNINSIFSSLVTALRLFKYGNVGIYDRYTTCSLDVPVTLPGVRLYAIALGSSEGQSYTLTDGEIVKFKKFWDRYGFLLIHKILDHKRYPNDRFTNIKNSFSRFNYGYARKNGNDKFVDFVIGLEAIYSKKDDRPGGFTNRFSKRASIFLEQELQKRRLLYCEMRNLYGLRSEIVHGGHTDKIDIIKIRSHLVKSYVKYLELMKTSNNFSHDKLISQLDNSPNQLRASNCFDQYYSHS